MQSKGVGNLNQEQKRVFWTHFPFVSKFLLAHNVQNLVTRCLYLIIVTYDDASLFCFLPNLRIGYLFPFTFCFVLRFMLQEWTSCIFDWSHSCLVEFPVTTTQIWNSHFRLVQVSLIFRHGRCNQTKVHQSDNQANLQSGIILSPISGTSRDVPDVSCPKLLSLAGICTEQKAVSRDQTKMPQSKSLEQTRTVSVLTFQK